MTNGEKIKEIFPDGVLTSINNSYYWGNEILVSKSWWNAEYTEPTTKNDLGVDAVSRQAINRYIDYILSHGMGKKKSFDFIKKFVANLTPVTPQEPKTGHWIESDSVLVMGNSETDNFMSIPAKECSVCHKPHIRAYGMNYCPNCGCRMVEPQESEG